MTRENDRRVDGARREWLGMVAAGAGLLLASPVLGVARALAPESAAPVRMTVYKSPTCGCCGKWVDLAKAAGYAVTVKDAPDITPTKRMLRVPERLWSCHTVVVGGYALEGHVPLDLVAKLLREKPKALGIAVPGMPAGSPGMEVGGMKDPYEVILFTADGRTSVYARR